MCSGWALQQRADIQVDGCAPATQSLENQTHGGSAAFSMHPPGCTGEEMSVSEHACEIFIDQTWKWGMHTAHIPFISPR